MNKKQLGALALSAGCALAFTLSGCTRVDRSTAGTNGDVFSDYESASSLYDLSSDPGSSSGLASSDGVSSVQIVKPNPAPVQPITDKVTEDPKFKPTEQDKNEDPQKKPPTAGKDQEMGPGGTITVPEAPPSKPSGGTSSAVSSAGVSSTGTSSASTPSVSSKPPASSSPPASSKPPVSSSVSSKPGSSSSGPASSSPPASSKPPVSSAVSSSPAATWPSGNYTGWWETAGKRYCYVNGKKLTGWQNVNNISYYFDADGAVSSKCGIDVSVWNGTIDWEKVKADGVDFVFIRAGYRGYGTGKIVIDTNFVKNVEGAHKAGLEVGVYFFSQAINKEEGKAEAEWTLNAIQDYPYIQYLVIDSENATGTPGEGRADLISKQDRTDAVEAFCLAVQQAKKKPMIYANQSWFGSHLELSRLTMAEKWVARWASTITWNQPFSMWQSCSDGKVNGIKGNVDRDAWKIIE